MRRNFEEETGVPMISIKSDREISLMREAGKLNYLTHEEVKKHIKPGVKTKDLDKVAYDFITRNHARPSFLNYEGYPASICVSINDEVVHGIPGERRIKDGDVVSIDIGVEIHGYHSDAARTYVVGSASKEIENLVKNTELALYAGLQKIHEGAKIGDNSIVGSNTMVNNEIPCNCLAVGTPCKVVKSNVSWTRERIF